MTMPSAPVDGPPLDPSSPGARQWVLDELARGGYTTQPSPVQRFVQWLMDLLTGPGAGVRALFVVWAGGGAGRLGLRPPQPFRLELEG